VIKLENLLSNNHFNTKFKRKGPESYDLTSHLSTYYLFNLSAQIRNLSQLDN